VRDGGNGKPLPCKDEVRIMNYEAKAELALIQLGLVRPTRNSGERDFYCWQPFPSATLVSTPLAAVMVRLKHPPVKSCEK
jgi:hypothetical protein